ncbi:MAG: lauroyl acyltransferase [Proteobacteria bacterium]|nr:lauroyl acyltransferase [Pseudomonadota bacterium]
MADRAPWRHWLILAARPLVAAVVFTGYELLGCVSFARASAIGGGIARRFGPLIPVTRRARRNLERAFPDKTPAEITAIIGEMWDNLGRVAAEYPHLARLRVFAEDSPIETRGMEHIDRALARGRPIIFFAAHLANWEIASLVALRYGVPVHLVYRPANNPWVDRLFRSGRAAISGGLIVKGNEGARGAVAVLRAGKHLGMLLDQKMNDGIAVPFFGRDAMTAPALAQFALKYDCTVLPAQVERLAGARFRLTVHPPLELAPAGERHADILAVMTRVNQLIEGWIREHPGQWLWLHRRWPD